MEADITSASRFYFSPVLYMMYNINKGLAVVATAGLFACSAAFGDVYWVDGVDEKSGWYDVNKVPAADGVWVGGDKGDERVCHAAAAANLVAWWQNRYKGTSLLENRPTEAKDIWQTYKSHQVADVSGTIAYSFQWWITGVNKPETADEAARTMSGYSSVSKAFESTEGFFFDYLSSYATGKFDSGADTGIAAQLNAFIETINVSSFSEAATTMINAMEAGKGIGLRLKGSSGAHAVTLWGIETNVQFDGVSSVVHKLWLTDSDDSKKKFGGFTDPCLFYVFVTENAQGEMEILNHGDSDTALVSDHGLDKFIVTGITTIDPSVSDKWFESALPEPTTATLSLMALAALAARRRRK